jgi:hypothetical protein
VRLMNLMNPRPTEAFASSSNTAIASLHRNPYSTILISQTIIALSVTLSNILFS